jgi:hypothetical protein
VCVCVMRIQQWDHGVRATGGALITSRMNHVTSASIFIDRSQ